MWVTACSVRYSFLPAGDMARIIHKAASMNAVLILQANDEIDSVPAKTLDLHRQMHDNGNRKCRSIQEKGLRGRCSWVSPGLASKRKRLGWRPTNL